MACPTQLPNTWHPFFSEVRSMSFHRVFDPVPDPTRGTAPAQLGWRRNSATKALKGRSWPGPVRRREAFGSRPFASEVETRQPSQPSAPDGDKGDWYTDWQVNTKNNFKTKTHTHTARSHLSAAHSCHSSYHFGACTTCASTHHFCVNPHLDCWRSRWRCCGGRSFVPRIRRSQRAKLEESKGKS